VPSDRWPCFLPHVCAIRASPKNPVACAVTVPDDDDSRIQSSRRWKPKDLQHRYNPSQSIQDGMGEWCSHNAWFASIQSSQAFHFICASDSIWDPLNLPQQFSFRNRSLVRRCHDPRLGMNERRDPPIK
jgi:hypothetical protein